MFGAHKFRTITLKNLVEFLNWIKIGYISRRLCIAINFNLKYLLILKKFYYYNYICSFFKYYNDIFNVMKALRQGIVTLTLSGLSAASRLSSGFIHGFGALYYKN